MIIIGVAQWFASYYLTQWGFYMYSRGTIDLVSYTTSCDGELNNRSISETLTLEQRMRA